MQVDGTMIPIPALLVLTAALAQDAAPVVRPAHVAERWVIHLADGRVHRGLARESGDGFEIRREKDWETVSRDQVARAVLEREVLSDIATRRREAGADLPRRVDVARFALDEGLLAESIGELDQVLALDPDCAPARDLVASAPLALTLPATTERNLPARLVIFGARAKPAYRELAAARLAAMPREAVLPELERALRSPSASVRAFAAFALRRIDPRLRADALVRRSVVDPAEPVRIEAARGLRDAGDETLARRVEAALALEDGRLRTNAAASLAEMGYRSSVPALVSRLSSLASSSHPGGYRAHIRVGNQVAYVQDFNPEIAQGSSIADPIVNVVEDMTELDVRVGGTSSQHVELEGPTICRALARLTGERLPEQPSPWLAWWKENAARFAAESHGESERPSTGR